ncbi:MAG TPA: type IV secretion system protein [Streptosporangiaceae bacterium]|nr:type IV secretion system protein [Streptosporangiaceae bacterium]
MLRLRRLPRKIAVALVVAIAVLSVPHVAASAAPTKTAATITPVRLIATVPSARGSVGSSSRVGTTRGEADAIPAMTVSASAPAGGGICSVPGIGDIGGLLGFCSIGQSGITGTLNNLCQPGVPQPESATSGIDSLIKPPNGTAGSPIATPYNQYGTAGQYWAATNLQCSDMTSLIGNDVAGMIFDFAKALDRMTITVYQSAAGEGILSWLQGVTDHLITGLGNAIYFPYVALIVIIGAIWLAWQGLIRKRGTRTIEGTIWMVIACAAAIWLIGRPADFTGLGKGVSDGISATLNTAFAHLPSPGQASCLPVTAGDPQINPTSFSYTSGRTVVDQNANELWTVLVCKPWLDGEFGTTAYALHGGARTPVNAFARPLLWAQAIAVNERPTTALVQAKQAAYVGIAKSIQTSDPSVYPLFQGKEWTTRLEIGFAALLAALVAGVLILLISVTLILLKLGFLLLLIVGPFFLLVGTHPGFGRVIAVRWFEMLVGVLLKQAAVALALSVLLYCYALIMGTADAVLPWALKILMITLVTVAVFIYRKPFQHLFASVGYSAIGASDRAEADLSRAAATARANTRTAATLAVPGFAGYRVAKWARRNPAQAAGLALGAATAISTASLAAGAAAADGGGAGGEVPVGVPSGGSSDPTGVGAAAQAGAASRARSRGASAGASSSGDQAPPLRLPNGQGASTSWAHGAPSGNGAGGAGGPAGGVGGGSAAGRGTGAASRAAGPASSAASSARPSAPPLSTATSGQRWPSGSGNGLAGSASRPPVPARTPPPPGTPLPPGTPPPPRPAAPPRTAAPRTSEPRTSEPRPSGPTRSSPSPGPRSGSGGPFHSLGSRRQPPPPASGRPSSASGRPSSSPARPSSAARGSSPYSGSSDFRPVEPPPEPGSPLSGPPRGGEDNGPGPFWLRPVRRRK